VWLPGNTSQRAVLGEFEKEMYMNYAKQYKITKIYK
jgi:hypothetical protein